MMAWTDRHDRFFLRLISRRALLYTEMVTTGALIHGNRGRFLAYSSEEHPLALQLGGCDPRYLARCAHIAEEYGFAEVNLNVGCPSDRVQNARFGACLMAEPELVADGVAAMRDACTLPVTVKTRIGIDDMDTYDALERFVQSVAAAGCHTFIVHARKAWLKGLSPKENREIPPLDHARVHQLKREHPELEIVINGGIQSLDDAENHLRHVDGVMLGRDAYQNPCLLADVDERLFDSTHHPARDEIIQALLPYVESELSRGAALKHITRHILGLYRGEPGGRLWRSCLSEEAPRPGAGPEVIQHALRRVQAARESAQQRQAA